MSSCLKSCVLKHDAPVPRYTSYPTAPHFRQDLDSDGYRAWLESVPFGADLSLYLHVPFCPKLCWFCGCHTKIVRRYDPVENYARLLQREISMTAAALGRRHYVRRLHFGGGSPSMLSPGDFAALVGLLHENFQWSRGAEMAVEIDPRQASEAKIATYAKAGVTRASFGVQDFDDTVLAAVNRPQPFHCTYEAVKMCRSYGIGKINMDFIYGLPHQTQDTMRRAMEYALTMMPDRIALFGYAHVPWMKKHMRLIPEKALPDSSLRYELFSVAADMLEDAGYVRIGIDHFARPEDSLARALESRSLHRNFQGYTDDTAGTLIGLGLSAVGKLPQGYVQNTVHNPQYAEAVLSGRLPVAKSCAISAEDRLRADVIENLMCYLEADIPALCRRHGFPPDFLEGSLHDLAGLAEDGLLQVSAGNIVTIADRLAARAACAQFDSYLKAAAVTAPRHASAV